MSAWSLPKLFAGLHDDIQQRLENCRKSLHNPGAKGDASQSVWLQLFQKYLPRRYQAESAFVVDSKGEFSDQIDIVIFDRQYSPFIFNYEGQIIVPAESIYAVFEAKQVINSSHVRYSQDKVASVRRLHRTSLPIPYAHGTYPAKPPIPIYGGVLAFESDWDPALGGPLCTALSCDTASGTLDFGCVAAHGYFYYNPEIGDYSVLYGGKPATSFLLRLISQLQFSGTVPMIDVDAYAFWVSAQP